MKFVDPFPTTCGRCLATSVQRVQDLLGLRASCPNCGASLDEVGRQMRAQCDDWGEFCTLAVIAIALEEMVGEAISDAELGGAHTLRDVARVVQSRLPPGSHREARSLELVLAAAKRVAWLKAVDVRFDVPLMDAVDPNRWNGR
jgi:hypothetical protein